MCEYLLGCVEMDPNSSLARIARKVVGLGRRRLYGEFGRLALRPLRQEPTPVWIT